MSDWTITLEQQVQNVEMTLSYNGDNVTVNVLQTVFQGGGDMMKVVYDPANKNEQVLTISSSIDGGEL